MTKGQKRTKAQVSEKRAEVAPERSPEEVEELARAARRSHDNLLQETNDAHREDLKSVLEQIGLLTREILASYRAERKLKEKPIVTPEELVVLGREVAALREQRDKLRDQRVKLQSIADDVNRAHRAFVNGIIESKRFGHG